MKLSKYVALIVCTSLFCGCDKNNIPNDNDDNLDSGSDVTISCGDGKDLLEVGYWTEEHELNVRSSSEWELVISDNIWVEFWNEGKNVWEKTSKLKGSGNVIVKLKNYS